MCLLISTSDATFPQTPFQFNVELQYCFHPGGGCQLWRLGVRGSYTRIMFRRGGSLQIVVLTGNIFSTHRCAYWFFNYISVFGVMMRLNMTKFISFVSFVKGFIRKWACHFLILRMWKSNSWPEGCLSVGNRWRLMGKYTVVDNTRPVVGQ